MPSQRLLVGVIVLIVFLAGCKTQYPESCPSCTPIGLLDTKIIASDDSLLFRFPLDASTLDGTLILFVLTAYLFQIILIVHFAMRKWRFEAAMRWGPLVYALGIPAAVVSTILLLGGMNWVFWLGGLLYLVWAIYGYTVEYVRQIEWRSPMRWLIGGPYLILYLATVMFYWWPLGLIEKPLWYAYALFFLASTILNLTSHKRPQELQGWPSS